MLIKCVGRRTILVSGKDGKVLIEIKILDKHLATLVLEKDEAVRLVGELNGLIRFDTSP
jgi:hypothetical protein